MKKQRMKGVVDPITLAFVLVIAGTAATLTMGTDDKSTQNQSSTAANNVESVVMLRSQ